MSRYYDRSGKPMTMQEWGKAFEGERHIGRTQVGDSDVSTVWLGLDHQWGDGPPLIFETMVFENGEGGDMRRYSTEEEAKAGHESVVAALRAKLAFKGGVKKP